MTRWYLTKEGNTKILSKTDGTQVAWYHSKYGWSDLKRKIEMLSERNIEVVEI